MANIENLKVPTSEEARKYGRKGGIASGKARREKKTMRETLEMLLEMETKSGRTNREEITIGLINGAKKGNATNYRTVLETLGELLPQENTTTPIVEINVVDNSNLEKIMYEENRHNKNDEGKQFR